MHLHRTKYTTCTVCAFWWILGMGLECVFFYHFRQVIVFLVVILICEPFFYRFSLTIGHLKSRVKPLEFWYLILAYSHSETIDTCMQLFKTTTDHNLRIIQIDAPFLSLCLMHCPILFLGFHFQKTNQCPLQMITIFFFVFFYLWINKSKCL